VNLSRKVVETARDRSADPWDWGNQVLYDLCREWPDHQQEGVIIAKAWLIGRAYGASLERGIAREVAGPTGLGMFYRDVASVIRSSDLDDHIVGVRGKATLDVDALVEVLEAHAYLVGILKELTGRRKRSFASKYLHFHVPRMFPVYDSIADRHIRKLLPGRRGGVVDGLVGHGDPEYRSFSRRVLELRSVIQHQFDIFLDPRELDRLLWVSSPELGGLPGDAGSA